MKEAGVKSKLRTPKVFASRELSPAARHGEQALGRLSRQFDIEELRSEAEWHVEMKSCHLISGG
jgi:hypothetical protein